MKKKKKIAKYTRLWKSSSTSKHRRTGLVHFGGTHIFGQFCTNPESTARIPASAENLAGGGGGGGSYTLFHRARNLLYII